jgi:hypothetical protein
MTNFLIFPAMVGVDHIENFVYSLKKRISERLNWWKENVLSIGGKKSFI